MRNADFLNKLLNRDIVNRNRMGSGLFISGLLRTHIAFVVALYQVSILIAESLYLRLYGNLLNISRQSLLSRLFLGTRPYRGCLWDADLPQAIDIG